MKTEIEIKEMAEANDIKPRSDVVMIKKTPKPIAYENINLKLSNLELNALLGLTFEYKKNLNNKNDSFSEREKQVIKKLEKSIIEAQILIQKDLEVKKN